MPSTDNLTCPTAPTCDCTATAPPHRWSDEVTDAEIAAAQSIGLMSVTACEQEIVITGNPGDHVLWIRFRDPDACNLWDILSRIESAHPGYLLRGMCNAGVLDGEVC